METFLNHKQNSFTNKTANNQYEAIYLTHFLLEYTGYLTEKYLSVVEMISR